MGCRRWWRLVGPVNGCARMNLSLTTPVFCGGCSCFRVICDDRGLVARTAVPRAQECRRSEIAIEKDKGRNQASCRSVIEIYRDTSQRCMSVGNPCKSPATLFTTAADGLNFVNTLSCSLMNALAQKCPLLLLDA